MQASEFSHARLPPPPGLSLCGPVSVSILLYRGGGFSSGENYGTPKFGALVYSHGNHSPWHTKRIHKTILWSTHWVHKIILWDTQDTQEKSFGMRTSVKTDPDMQHPRAPAPPCSRKCQLPTQGARNCPDCAKKFSGGVRHQSEKRNPAAKFSPAEISPPPTVSLCFCCLPVSRLSRTLLYVSTSLCLSVCLPVFFSMHHAFHVKKSQHSPSRVPCQAVSAVHKAPITHSASALGGPQMLYGPKELQLRLWHQSLHCPKCCDASRTDVHRPASEVCAPPPRPPG